ncbi:DUF7542 family protein [Halorubrum lipolyticum]|nr:hypothetical protein [Halorubrum lipolyticum]
MTRVHVVCRDCDFEQVKISKTVAANAALDHEDETGHETEYEVVAK